MFVYAMLTMALTGAGIAAVTRGETSVVMGGLAAYRGVHGMDGGALLTSSAVGQSRHRGDRIRAGRRAGQSRGALPSPSGAIEGLLAPMAFVFAAVATLAGISDLRLLTRPVLPARAKLTRHLWRMCGALFIASALFFLGQAQVIPAPSRRPVLLALPVLTPLGATAFWAWRMRRWRTTMPVAVVSHAATV